MRTVILIISMLCCCLSFATQKDNDFKKDSLLIIKRNPAKGFHHDYLLFIPKGTPMRKRTHLLVEPNNTGLVSDSIEVHMKHAIGLASVSSVGNNIATELKIPLLVPVFPRPESDSLVYTHALDRDAMLIKSGVLKRLDLQLLNMIKDAQEVLARMAIPHREALRTGFHYCIRKP